jgi:hypothetical protein
MAQLSEHTHISPAEDTTEHAGCLCSNTIQLRAHIGKEISPSWTQQIASCSSAEVWLNKLSAGGSRHRLVGGIPRLVWGILLVRWGSWWLGRTWCRLRGIPQTLHKFNISYSNLCQSDKLKHDHIHFSTVNQLLSYFKLLLFLCQFEVFTSANVWTGGCDLAEKVSCSCRKSM